MTARLSAAAIYPSMDSSAGQCPFARPVLLQENGDSPPLNDISFSLPARAGKEEVSLTSRTGSRASSATKLPGKYAAKALRTN